MRKLIVSVALVCVLTIAGCAALDDYFGVDNKPGDPAPLNKQIGDSAGLLVPAPWGEIVGLALAGVGSAYIAVRRIQKRIEKNKNGG